MKVAAVVQARMSSQRLPGKSLLPLAGRPLLSYICDRLERAGSLDGVIVATSTDTSDDPLARFCATEGIVCERGPLEDVASRLFAVAERHELDAFVRISGDSPLIDQQLVDRAVALFRETRPSVVTNVHPRTFPHGESVEVLDTDALRRALGEMTSSVDREHVTPYLYRHPECFSVRSFCAPADWSPMRLVVDTAEDVATIERMLEAMTQPHWDYRCDELVALLTDAKR